MNKAANPKQHLEAVATYYGETLQSTNDLKTSACCPAGTAPPPEHIALLKKLHPEVTSRFYGCGSPIPPYVKGNTVLDLGCGTGRDVYLLSGLVGTEGKVIGVDMTPAQLEVARKHQEYHAEALLGSSTSNVDIRDGYIENLAAAGIEESSIDIVVSNCVCNLSPDKKAVFSQVARALKPGGEFYFSDIYTDRRLSSKAQNDDELVGECLGGALYLNDFVHILREVGLSDPRIITASVVEVADDRLKGLVPDVTFYSLTVRVFKMGASPMEPELESFGEKATYTGEASSFTLDSSFTFSKNIPVEIDANTAHILRSSRYGTMFKVTNKGPHQGLFSSTEYRPVILGMLQKALKTSTTTNGKQDAGKQVSKGCHGPSSTSTKSGCCAPGVAMNGGGADASGGGCRRPQSEDVPASSPKGGGCCGGQKAEVSVSKEGSCCAPKQGGGCC
eukprot:Plantae.Rhodophyta-Hildenbrandia_rubra.ctg3576.p1 GENE.Plantae.Rhodophyta-Hildenbrandia_rubra.ctg3576~~Plantae.Rhodophyta-Hildenbrandia_rubra.ctg3576.p1  ORF type:complete len:447 (+),score=64.21 Plantae.Rhodophyta-Hildenbrandia_rubra.ctg3576:976-2316(+)